MVRALICYICYLDTQLAFEKAAVRFSPMVVLELEYLYEIVWDQRYDPDSNPFPIIAEIAIGETWTRDPFDRLIVSMPRPTDGLAWSLRMNSSPDITQTPFGKRRPSVRVWPWARPAYTEGSRLTNPEAEDLYLKGRYYWNKRTPDDLNKAVDLFTEHDPGYAKAYAGLADTYNLLREFSLMPSNQAFSRSLAAARRMRTTRWHSRRFTERGTSPPPSVNSGGLSSSIRNTPPLTIGMRTRCWPSGGLREPSRRSPAPANSIRTPSPSWPTEDSFSTARAGAPKPSRCSHWWPRTIRRSNRRTPTWRR